MNVKIFSKCGGYFSKLSKISSQLEFNNSMQNLNK